MSGHFSKSRKSPINSTPKQDREYSYPRLQNQRTSSKGTKHERGGHDYKKLKALTDACGEAKFSF